MFYVYPPGKLIIADFKQALHSIAAGDSKVVIFYETKFHKLLPELQEVVSDLPSVWISELVGPNNADASVVCGRRIPEPFEKAVFIGHDSMLLTNLNLIFPGNFYFQPYTYSNYFF